jgi:hypothetical protein
LAQRLRLIRATQANGQKVKVYLRVADKRKIAYCPFLLKNTQVVRHQEPKTATFVYRACFDGSEGRLVRECRHIS